MSDSSHTSWWQDYRALVEQGDKNAHRKLIERSACRFEELARQMLRHYPAVQRWEQTGDVVQNATLRLLRALEEIEPESPKHYMRLATLQIRRELIDLARKYRGEQGWAANHASQAGGDSSSNSGAGGHGEPHDLSSETPSDLASWCELHEAIERLPETDYELCVWMFYQGLTQSEVAELLNVSDRTVRRRWQAVRLKLYELMQAHLSFRPHEDQPIESEIPADLRKRPIDD